MIRLATFNLCNFGIGVEPPRLERLARVVAHDLGGPELLAVQEVGAPGPADPQGVVPAEAAYRRLAAAVAAAGGPEYDFREVAPFPNRDGGQAGFNIRVGLLFDPRRIGVVERGTAGPEDPVAVRCRQGRAELDPSPGRVEPQHPAFAGDLYRHWRPSRKTLAAELRVADQTLFVLVCHFKSMRAALRRDEDYAKKQRHAQAEVVQDFVAQILACDPGAAVVVMGDLNDVPGSKTLKLLKGERLDNLVEAVVKRDRYTRLHGARRQALDHILVTPRLRRGARIRIAHGNAETGAADRASDHDPVLAELAWP